MTSWPWLAAGRWVWDWDQPTGLPVVPPDVMRATFLQALSIAQGTREDRLNDRHDGITSQSALRVSESYSSELIDILCLRARTLMRRFRLRTGRIV